MKYEEWLKEWLVLYVKPTTKERTYKKYFKLAETHIIPSLGGIRFHLKVCYSVVIFAFPLSRFQTRVYLLRFQTIPVLPAIMPGQANLSRNPGFP